MSIKIASSGQFASTLSTHNVVIADFYADWCGPCKQIAPLFEQLATKHSKKGAVAFVKVNVDSLQPVAQQYGVSAMPTFLIFHGSQVHKTLRGADPHGLTSAVEAAVRLPPKSKPVYSTPGRTLGGSTGSRSATSSFTVQGFFDGLIAFFGLYLVSLFSIDPYRAAEASPFNVNRRPEVKIAGARPGQQPVRRVGTLADVSGS